MSETFDYRLKSARQMANVRANKLAASVGISTGYLSQLENGKRTDPSADLVDRIAAELGVSLDWLVSGKGGTVVQACGIREEPRPATCPQCEAKDIRIAGLERQMERANETIASQARTIEAMQGRSPAVRPPHTNAGNVHAGGKRLPA
jgi:transcriptional regulator with XRE-family HTH domain